MKDRMDSTQVRTKASDNHRGEAGVSPIPDATAEVATGSRPFFDQSSDDDLATPSRKGARWIKAALFVGALAAGGAGFGGGTDARQLQVSLHSRPPRFRAVTSSKA